MLRTKDNKESREIDISRRVFMYPCIWDVIDFPQHYCIFILSLKQPFYCWKVFVMRNATGSLMKSKGKMIDEQPRKGRVNLRDHWGLSFRKWRLGHTTVKPGIKITELRNKSSRKKEDISWSLLLPCFGIKSSDFIIRNLC